MGEEGKAKVRCVIYDCDGVLFDSFEANSRLYNDLCARVGREPLGEDERAYVHSHTVYESIRFLFGKGDDLERKALEALKEVDLRDYIAYLKMEPHLLETLNRLKKDGVLRAINTNRTTSMKHIMDRFGLWPVFDMVVTALDVKHPKPHPESIEKILRQLHLTRDEVVFVGDTEVDQQTARASGIPFIAYKNGALEADFHIDDHLDLFRYPGLRS
ncbi:MAG: HAD family hydrolase [Desulfobacterota bacterium]|nr:HAD family hydrolase [Thermodesulfobacteriota bacterium]